MAKMSLNDYRKQKLGSSFKPEKKLSKNIIESFGDTDLMNRNIYIKELVTEDFDSLAFGLMQKGAIIVNDLLSCDTLLTSAKNGLKANDVEIIHLSDLLRNTNRLDDSAEKTIYNVDLSKPKKIESSEEYRIIPLDESKYIENSLDNLKIAFVGDFLHFNETSLSELIQKLGGNVVDTNSDFNFMVCGKGANPLEITDSLQKVLSERDFIRKITR